MKSWSPFKTNAIQYFTGGAIAVPYESQNLNVVLFRELHDIFSFGVLARNVWPFSKRWKKASFSSAQAAPLTSVTLELRLISVAWWAGHDDDGGGDDYEKEE